MRSLKCIICEKKINELHLSENNSDISYQDAMWDDAAVDLFIPNYGSKYDLDKMILCLCDDCISKKIKQGLLLI